MWLVGPSPWYSHGRPGSVPAGECTPFEGEAVARSDRVAWNWRGSVGGTGASRWCCGGRTGSGERSAAAASSMRVLASVAIAIAIRRSP
jgi:hypothetical protein